MSALEFGKDVSCFKGTKSHFHDQSDNLIQHALCDHGRQD